MTRRGNAATMVALATILLAGLAFRLIYWYGLVNVDPYAYADAAASVANGEGIFDPDTIGSLYYTQYLRLTLILPAAAAYWAAGPGETQSIVFPLVCSLATGLVAFGLAWHVSGDRLAGVIACLVTVFFPESVINSTQFLPDGVMAFFSGLAILGFWLGLDSRDKNWRTRAALFAGAGAAWALAFYGRQTAVGLALPLGLLALYYRRLDWAILAGVCGALVVGTLMSLVLLALGGELFEDIRTVIGESRGSQPGALGYTDLDFSYAKLFLKDGRFVPLTVLALAGAVLTLAAWRDIGPPEKRRVLGLGIVCFGLFVYFEFLMRLPSLYSWWKEPRYVLSLVAPLAAISGVGLSRWLRMFNGHTRAVASGYLVVALAGLVIVNLDSVRADHAYWQANRIDAAAGQVAAVLDDRPEQPVYIWNDDLARYLAFHVGLDRTTYYERANDKGYLRNRFDEVGHSLVKPGSLVIISPGQDSWPKPTAPASHWIRIWDDGAGTTIWSIPSTPEGQPLQQLAASLTSTLAVTGFGVSSKSVLPNQHVALTMETENLGAATEIRVAVDCSGDIREAARFPVPSGRSVTSVDATISVGSSAASRQCRWAAAASEDRWASLGNVEVGRVVFLEPEDSFSHDIETEGARGSGWYRVDQPFYSGGGSAVALAPFEPLYLVVSEIEGDIWIDVGVYDYGSGTNTLSVSVNGTVGEVSWGGETVGMVHRILALQNVPAGGLVKLVVVSATQPALTVDSVAIATIPPP